MTRIFDTLNRLEAKQNTVESELNALTQRIEQFRIGTSVQSGSQRHRHRVPGNQEEEEEGNLADSEDDQPHHVPSRQRRAEGGRRRKSPARRSKALNKFYVRILLNIYSFNLIKYGNS